MNDDFNFDELFTDDTAMDEAKEAFDKEKWIEEKIRQKEDAYEKIDLMTEAVTTDENALIDYLNLSARFPSYGASNTLLILAQNPFAAELRTFDEWKAANVSVKKGEKGILILEKTSEYIKPDDNSIGYNYTAKTLFDITQTNAEMKEKIPANIMEVIKALLKSSPVPFTSADYLDGDIKCFFDTEENRIFIVKSSDSREMFYALTTEFAHARMWYKNKDYKRYSYNDKARCVSYLLAERYGFDPPELPVGSLDMFSDCDTIAAKREILNEITRTAGAISHSMEKIKERIKFGKDER